MFYWIIFFTNKFFLNNIGSIFKNLKCVFLSLLPGYVGAGTKLQIHLFGSDFGLIPFLGEKKVFMYLDPYNSRCGNSFLLSGLFCSRTPQRWIFSLAGKPSCSLVIQGPETKRIQRKVKFFLFLWEDWRRFLNVKMLII